MSEALCTRTSGSMAPSANDLDGSSILSWETVTMRRPFEHYMVQAEMLIHTALDMNAPGAHGWVHITYYGGGWNPFLFLNPIPLAQFAAWFEGQFRGRLKLALFIEMPAAFIPLVKMMMQFLKPATKEKIMICTEAQALQALGRLCDEETVDRIRHYMMNRRGGRNVKQHWHPIVDIPWFHERLRHLQLEGASTYSLSPGQLQVFRQAIRDWRGEHWKLRER
eukprot:CAMPEP_0179060776 /NCGR_PEP_ID=MMETSP0796-20121207/26039_1 /TAXON_ID=73915 /ORGANISM="Pyrodinium bahamense, Strain pbaha01" /LENGTH=221 /DNA_ID=CAMNT_0020757567 /DNA_START=183 /DNA_END=844 /DNA_ORIENTATION=+